MQARALLIAQTEAILSSQITARITRVNVDIGQRFKKGDSLISFDCEVQRATREKIRAALDVAVITVKSYQKLKELGSTSQLEYAQALAEEQKARAELKEITAQIKKCSIYAPFSGRVVERKVYAFETVTQGDELIEIIDDSSLAVDLLVPSHWISWLKKNHMFEIQISETGETVKAYIDEVGPRIDPVSQTIKVRAKLSEHSKSLLAGMTGQAVFHDSQ